MAPPMKAKKDKNRRRVGGRTANFGHFGRGWCGIGIGVAVPEKTELR
ncbi:hypothetical protein CK203_074456 [Vitis vinifera]|uniref:Uncharacterized protein n=1 Tax=Vitis vinifera TaxID=29760 RepID=A0A438EGV9_VITVI|nr:hypothetical protein CK203_074456 [Vitis vinifera]